MRLNIAKYVDHKFPKSNYDRKTNISAFASSIGVSFAAAKAIYRGETTKISFDVLEKICLVLECTPNDILVMEPVSEDVRKDTKNILSKNGITFDGTKKSEEELEQIIQKLNDYIQVIKK